VTVLDGDVVRTHLSSELSFSREDRDLNIRRIGFVAGEVVKHGGTVVVAAIAPYEAAREEARALVERHGRFVLVHLSTPLEVCEGRDVKGLYARARAGQLTGFTGIDDPYEPPARAEVVIDTSAPRWRSRWPGSAAPSTARRLLSPSHTPRLALRVGRWRRDRSRLFLVARRHIDLALVAARSVAPRVTSVPPQHPLRLPIRQAHPVRSGAADGRRRKKCHRDAPPRTSTAPQRGQGQWALGYREPLNPNERMKKDADGLDGAPADPRHLRAHRASAASTRATCAAACAGWGSTPSGRRASPAGRPPCWSPRSSRTRTS
jgi:hypothetical protein